jgi:hypothetical protein
MGSFFIGKIIKKTLVYMYYIYYNVIEDKERDW